MSKTLRLFYKIFSVYKILVPSKNQPLPITMSQDKQGGHNSPPHPLRVKSCDIDLMNTNYLI